MQGNAFVQSFPPLLWGGDPIFYIPSVSGSPWSWNRPSCPPGLAISHSSFMLSPARAWVFTEWAFRSLCMSVPFRFLISVLGSPQNPPFRLRFVSTEGRDIKWAMQKCDFPVKRKRQEEADGDSRTIFSDCDVLTNPFKLKENADHKTAYTYWKI